MDVFYMYTYGTSAWLGLQGVTLAAAPKIVITMLLDETRPPSSLEMYFSRLIGFSFLTIAVITLVLTGSIPLTSSYAVTPEESDPKAPYAVPSLSITSAFHATSAFYIYTWFAYTGQVSYAVAMAVHAGLATVGLWCLLFASSEGRISRRTGADKRMTGFPFKNAEADKKREGKKKVF